jgi:hypothetical protein
MIIARHAKPQATHKSHADPALRTVNRIPVFESQVRMPSMLAGIGCEHKQKIAK